MDVFAIEQNNSHAFVNYMKVIEGSIVQTHTVEIKKRLEERPEELLAFSITNLRERFSSDAKTNIVNINPGLTGSFKNEGVRPSEVHISKRAVGINPVAHLSQQSLLLPGYFGNFGKVCHTQVDGQGIRIRCDTSLFSCTNRPLAFLGVAKSDLQFVLFHHVNDTGTQTASYAAIKSVSQSMLTGNAILNPIPDTYVINYLVNNIDDIDVHRKNVDLIDVSLQQMGSGKNSLLCMSGRIFEGNSLIKGVKVLNWQQ